MFCECRCSADLSITLVTIYFYINLTGKFHSKMKDIVARREEEENTALSRREEIFVVIEVPIRLLPGNFPVDWVERDSLVEHGVKR